MRKYIVLGIWIVALAIIVVAAAPTLPTLSPESQAVFFDSFDVSCSGSTDGDGDTIYYAIYDNYQIDDSYSQDWTTNLTGASGYTGQNALNYIGCSANAGKCEVYKDVYFQDLNFSFQFETEAVTSASLEINGSTIWSTAGANPKTNVTIGVSNFTNKTSKMTWRSTHAAGGNRNLLVNWTAPLEKGYNVRGLSQNSSTDTTLTISKLLNLKRSYDWTCRACDNNGDCSAWPANRTISFANFTNCSDTNVALNISFINETSGLALDSGVAIDTFSLDFDSDDSTDYVYSYANADNHSSFGFCLTPSGTRVNGTLQIRVSDTGFPQRSLSFTYEYLGGYSYNKSIYMLPTGDGYYSTYQVINPAEQPLENTLVTAERLDGSTYTYIAGGYTDASGSITLWLDPTSNHRLNFTHASYPKKVVAIVPDDSEYTITLGAVELTNETNLNYGITYDITPKDSILTNSTEYNIGFNISSGYHTLSEYGFIIYGNNNTNLSSIINGSVAVGGYVNTTINTSTNTTIEMRYFWRVNDTYANGTQTWIVLETYQGQFSLMSFFDDLRGFSNSGFNDFTRVLIVFAIILIAVTASTLIVGSFSPTASMGIILALTWLFEYVEFLPSLNGERYLLTIFIGLIFMGYLLKEGIR